MTQNLVTSIFEAAVMIAILMIAFSLIISVPLTGKPNPWLILKPVGRGFLRALRNFCEGTARLFGIWKRDAWRTARRADLLTGIILFLLAAIFLALQIAASVPLAFLSSGRNTNRRRR